MRIAQTKVEQTQQSYQNNVPTDTVSTLVQHGGSTVAVIIAMSIFVLAIGKFSKTLLNRSNK